MNPEQNPADGGTNPSNMSLEEFIAQRTKANTPQPEEPETPEEISEEIPEVPETVIDEEIPDEEPEIEGAEEEEDEPENTEVDLLSLTPEQIQDLAKKGKSRLLHRIGELTAQKRALEAKLEETQQAAPAPAIPDAENPFRDLPTIEAVKAKYAELETTVEVTDRILEDNEDYGPDDIIDVEGKEFTKRQIRTANRNARQALLKFLPAQAATLQQREALKAMEAEYEKVIPAEVPEAQDEEGEVGKMFKTLREDPLVEQVRKRVPELAPQLNYILAHASASIIRSKAKPKVPNIARGATGKSKVTPSPGGATAAPSATSTRKKENEAYNRFQQTGSVDDWIAARTAKLSTS